jgi:hypothetical protein
MTHNIHIADSDQESHLNRRPRRGTILSWARSSGALRRCYEHGSTEAGLAILFPALLVAQEHIGDAEL